MRSADYWAERFTALDDSIYTTSEKYARNLQKQFDMASKSISRDIGYWYGRLAENNDISYAAAKKLLKDDELSDFHMTVQEYIKHGKEDGLDPEWIKKLENASAKVHISRLEQIQTDMQQTVEGLYKSYETGAEELLKGVTTTSYYHTAYEVAKGTGIGVNLHRLDIDTVSDFLSRPWCQDGKVFSDRIWTRKDELIESLNTVLAQNLMTGADPQKAIDQIAKKFDVDKRAAGRLIMTETAAIQNEARQKCMKDLDVEEFEFVATLDSHTSTLCRGMDGQHFPMSQFKIGLNAPPLHCNCRSTTVPWFDDEFTADETRAAREAGDTGYKQVPSNMTYKEWEKEYISDVNTVSSTETTTHPNTKEYINVAEVKEANASAGEQLEMIPKAHIDLLNENGIQIEFDNPSFSSYNVNEKEIHLKDSLSNQEAIHEVGHALEDILDVYSDPEYITILEDLVKDKELIYDPETFVKPIFKIEGKGLVSEYQGRLYEEVGCLLENGEINPYALGDVFSEGYAYYIANPQALLKANKDLYDYFRRMLPK